MTITQYSFARILQRSLTFAQTLGQRLHSRGITHTARWAWAGAALRVWDWKLGLDMRGELHGSGITDDKGCNGYMSIGAACFKSVMRRVGVGSEDVFLDYGSGKGRALLLAARHRFRKCIGIELSHELCDIALSNLSRARGLLRCQEIEVIEGDATAFQVPTEVSVIFLFNPFVGEVLQQVIARIHESLRECPRELRIAYIYPADEITDLFEPCEWLKKVHEEAIGVSTDHRFVVYRAQIEARN